MKILYKVIILTLLYWICVVMNTIIQLIPVSVLSRNIFLQCFLTILQMISSVAVNVSISFMMEHNKEKYFAFLRWVNQYKLHWICCYWRYMVVEQLTDDIDKDKLKKQVKNSVSTSLILSNDASTIFAVLTLLAPWLLKMKVSNHQLYGFHKPWYFSSGY